MKEQEREQVFVEKIVSELDKSAEVLDPGTLSRLRRVRMQALEGRRDRVWTGWRLLFRLPAAGLASAVVVLLAFVVYFALPMGGTRQSPVEDIEILANTDNLELYEDLDFYKWLTEEAQTREQGTWFRSTPSIQFAGNNSPWEGVVATGREERPAASQRPFPLVV